MQRIKQSGRPESAGRWRWRLAQWAELRWWQRYLSRREPSDYLRWKQRYWRQLLENLSLNVLPGARVLDAGCGPAGIFTVLDEQRVDALDPLLDAYADRLPHFDPLAYPQVQFHRGQLETWRATESYDWVFCLNAINHVDDLGTALGALQASVRPGGMLILSSDLHNYRWVKAVFRLLPGDVLHPQQHDIRDYRQLLSHPAWTWHEPQVYQRGGLFSYIFFVGKKREI